MALEREVKLRADGEIALPALNDLGGGLMAAPVEQLNIETVYFDTSDLRLTRWGYSLRYREGDMWTLKRPAAVSGAVVARDELTFAGAATVPPPAALRLLRAYVRREVLTPVAHLSTVRRRVRLQTADGFAAAEVDDDTVSVLESGDRFRQIEVELGVLADEDLLTRVLKRLRDAGAATPDPTSKLHRALGPRADEPPEVTPVVLAAKATAGDVVRHAIAASVATLFQHDAGIRLGDAPEDVHQARVAVRRLRSDLRTFSSLLDDEWLTSLRADLGWLAAELGTVRDADVLVSRLQAHSARLPTEDAAAASGLLDLAVTEGTLARQHLLEALDAERYLDLLERLIRAAQAPALLPAAKERARGLLPGLVAPPWRRLHRAVHALPTEPSDDVLHRVRILTKRCRYAAEAVSPVVGRRATRFARAAAAVQAVLGEYHDSVRAQAWLRELDRPPALLLAAGEMLAMEREAATSLATGWRKAWQTLHRKASRAWLT